MKPYLFLLLAIAFEIMGTTYLKKSEGFSQWGASVVTVISYLFSFYFLSLTLKVVPIGVAYAIWSGVGIIAITLLGIVFFKQKPDLPAIIGIGLIMLGVVIINLFSKMNSH
ncbi:small multidrug resistance pump [Catalinimonas alkaloidigena]|uniref:Small multidrug resistance pump n=1 Tax=Catalinimonas alkaloidigena TaxID=1075417 RepID=A0A1G9T6P7_9BACT|nr:SMR family transporter [Catalinimonas alkaloidigena]SDM42755.1 small multidrug resistance pump [Catalinimonas alkaloidigena]